MITFPYFWPHMLHMMQMIIIKFWNNLFPRKEKTSTTFFHYISLLWLFSWLFFIIVGTEFFIGAQWRIIEEARAYVILLPTSAHLKGFAWHLIARATQGRPWRLRGPDSTHRLAAHQDHGPAARPTDHRSSVSLHHQRPRQGGCRQGLQIRCVRAQLAQSRNAGNCIHTKIF